MIKKLFSVLLVLVMFFSIFTVAVAVDEEDYDVILLPVISDQLEQNKQVTQVQLYIDKKTNTAFVDLDVICELIGANCNYKKDWYIVDRDYTYFKYKGSGDMKLYLSHTDSGLLLLEGDLFESRMINNRWYVDYIKFCDMYGVKLQKIDSSIKSYITDDRFGDCYKKYINFEKNPYYIQMDTGVTLSSIYGEIIENKERYFWDYSSWSADDDSDIISKVLLSEAGISVGVQGGNLFSNIINDWDGFTSAIFSDYESDEHYTEALTDICNVKYINNAVKYKIDDPCKNDTMADTLQKGLTLWSTYDMYNESTEFFDKLLETNDYKEIFSSTDKSLKFEDIFSSVSKVGLNAVQKYCEQLMLCKRLNNISETKINMLQKGILENDSILNKAKNQEKVNDIITAIGKNPVNINNALIPDNLKIRNPFSKIYLNTFNNSEGLKESAQKMSNMYKNVDEQKKDKFNKIIETVKFSVSDEMIQTVFKNSGSAELSGFAFAMGIFDGMMGIAKTEFGEQLKQLEKLAQYYYIEKTLLNDLDEKNPENLYNRLLFALEASLCCFQSSSDESENEIKAITEVLLELDYDTEKLNINYYHDPRNNNVSNEIKNSILNYQTECNNGTISGKVLTKDKNPIKNAKIEVYTASDNTATRFGEDECYTNAKGEFSISMPEGKYLLVVTCDGYDPVNIEAVTVEKKKTKRVDDIYMKLYINKSDLYAAYLEAIKSIIDECGESKIGPENPKNESYVYSSSSLYRISGLSYAKLIDFDNDGTDELLCTYAPLTYNSKYNSYNCQQKIKIFNYDGYKANVIYEGSVMCYGGEPGYHIHYYVDEDMNTILLTRKNPQTFLIEEWSKLENGEFQVVKTFSDYPHDSDISADRYQAYKIDGVVVDQDVFSEELQKIKDKQEDIKLSRTSYEEAVAVVKITQNTLKTIGYKFNDEISGSCGDNVKYTLNSEGVLTISGNGEMNDYERYFESPFFGNQNIKKVVIENGVTTIGQNLFNSCHELTSIDIPNSVISIKSSAFWDCTSLKILNMPDSITAIGDSAFNNCSSLEKVKISESALNIGKFVFYNCKNLQEVTLPSQLKSIPSKMFSFCTSLQSIVLPNTVKTIGDCAFYDCESLKNPTLPNGILHIGEDAFSGCESLTSIVIPDNITSINKDTFWHCINLQSVKLHDKIVSIEEDAFGDCENLSDIELPPNLEKIGMSAFYKCVNIKNIRIPKSVKLIERNAFGDWTASQTIYIEGRSYAPSAWVENEYYSWDKYCNAKIVWNA